MQDKTLQKIILSEDSSIQEAIQALEDSHLRIIFAVDSNQIVTGVLADGDIRRALIGGFTLDSSIKNAINKNFISIDEHTSESEALALMQKMDILSIPVMQDGKVIRLISINDFANQQHIENPVLLMAGGFGKRLRPLTDNCPKPLLKIGNVPIIEMILKDFIKSGFKNFIISTHYLSSMIKDFLGNGSTFGINIEYLEEDKPLGTAGCLGLLPKEEIKLPLIMMNADILTKVNFLNLLAHHNKSESIATMCVRTSSHQVPYGVVNHSKSNELTEIIEKPSYDYFVNSGIYVLDPSILQHITEGNSLDMPELLNNLVSAKLQHRVSLYPLHEYWLDIGQIHDFDKAQLDSVSIFGD
jgi:dTDP-glucose pyrophosphorylase